MTIETEQEGDGRWLAEVMEMPGVMVYGATREEAEAKVRVLARQVQKARLMELAGCLSDEDAESIREAVAEGCESVDPEGW